MILVFGGTTEGRQAAEVLEAAANTYYYSTKTGEQQLTLHHGIRVDGAMDAEAMTAFISKHGIRLIVDAAHPFASQLHQTIASVASPLKIPVIRYERIYPPREQDITWIDDYSELSSLLPSSREGLGAGFTLLVTTGVQSISRLKWLEEQGVKVVYRILNRESSITLAHEQGVSDERLCFYPATVKADAILMKESGLSGGFAEKVEEARKLGMRIIVIKRPLLHFKHCVNGPHGLRRDIERLLPEFFPLHSGLTTGTCATAAAVAAVRRLLYGETPEEVPVILDLDAFLGNELRLGGHDRPARRGLRQLVDRAAVKRLVAYVREHQRVHEALDKGGLARAHGSDHADIDVAVGAL